MTKMTKREALERAIACLREANDMEEVADKLETMLAQVVKESTRERKAGPKAQAKEQEKEAFAQQVLEFVKENAGTGAKAVGEAFEVSPQKATSALSKLAKAGLIEREVVKGKATFKVA